MDTFQVLAEPTRRHIVELVAKNGVLAATDIGENFNSSLAAVSQHLKLLRDSRVLIMQKLGRQRLYSVNPQALKEVEHWVEKTKSMWSDRFDRLEKVLEQEKRKLEKKKNNSKKIKK